MAVVGTNHMELSKVAKPSKCKLVHSLLPCRSVVGSLWSSPPCAVDEFCYSVTSVEASHIQLTAVNVNLTTNARVLGNYVYSVLANKLLLFQFLIVILPLQLTVLSLVTD
jgi:hypothetical protein